MRVPFLLTLSLMLLLSGCFFVSTFQEPKVLSEGEHVLQLGVSGIANPGENGGVSVPFIPELAYRRGFGGGVDAGIRLGIGLIGMDVKYQFLDGPLYAAVNMGGSLFGVLTDEDSAVLGLYPAVLVGTRRLYAGYRHVFLTGTVEIWGGNSNFSQGVSTIVLGGVWGQRWQFLPEVNIYLPPEKGQDMLLSYGVGIRYRWGR